MIDYTTVSAVYDALLLNIDSLADLTSCIVETNVVDPLRTIGIYSVQGSSRTLAEFWGRVQSTSRLLVHGLQSTLRSTRSEVALCSNWNDFPGVGVPLVSAIFAVNHVRLRAGLMPTRVRLPFEDNRQLRRKVEQEFPGVEVTFDPPQCEVVYDRSDVLAVPQLPAAPVPLLTYADLLSRYYPPRLVQGALQVNALVGTLLFEEGREPTIDLLAERSGVPPHALQRRLSMGGLTVRAMVERLRIERAERLLGDTDVPIIDVAMDVGYGSQQALTKSFKRLRGLSPSEYRGFVARAAELPKLAQSTAA